MLHVPGLQSDPGRQRPALQSMHSGSTLVAARLGPRVQVTAMMSNYVQVCVYVLFVV